MKPFPIAVLLAVLLAGCATAKFAVTGSEPTLLLSESVTRSAGGRVGVTIVLPAGKYRPALRDAGGVYYRPSAEVIWRGKPMDHVMVYIPNDPAKPSALWLEGATATWEFEPRLEFTRAN